MHTITAQETLRMISWGGGVPDADGRCFDHLHLQDTDLLGKEGMLKRYESTVEIPSSLVGT